MGVYISTVLVSKAGSGCTSLSCNANNQCVQNGGSIFVLLMLIVCWGAMEFTGS
jgi:hypothetical protein